MVQPGITIPNNAERPHDQRAGPGLGDPAGPDRPRRRSDNSISRSSSTSAGLQGLGDNLYRRNAGLRHAAGPASPAPTAYGNLQQGNLEQANVEAVNEITDLIAAQRAYEMNAKVITAADQMLSSTSQMMR